MKRENLQIILETEINKYLITYNSSHTVDNNAGSDADGNRGQREEYLDIDITEVKNIRTKRVIPLKRINADYREYLNDFVKDMHCEQDLIEDDKADQADRDYDAWVDNQMEVSGKQ